MQYVILNLCYTILYIFHPLVTLNLFNIIFPQIAIDRWEGHHFTGHNSPFYALPEELDPLHPGYLFNANFSMIYWHQLGARKDQLLMGMATYGRGFRLADSSDDGFYAPANGPIDAGMYTGSAGFWGYNEFCEKMQTESNQWAFHKVCYLLFEVDVTV